MTVEFKRLFTSPQRSPYQIEWQKVHVPGNSYPVEAPSSWSLNAIEVAAKKYFRRKENESSVRQLFTRVVRAIQQSGVAQGYFDQATSEIFADELTHILLHQMGSFNSPVYFNVGIFSTYGVAGTAENFAWDESSRRVQPTTSAFIRPQASACFIQDVEDDLLSIFGLLKNEAKLFKYGSGTGTNFSRLRARGESLQGGGESTGLLSYLEIFDKAAQAIKSGGTNRRAAKMVVVDADHPEILEFIQWKMHEERKARILLANGYSGGMEGEAFRTVSGQNSNNSVSVTDKFLQAAQSSEKWPLHSRNTGNVVAEPMAREILRAMARAAWECADPGIQYYDTIQKWHMCPNSGPIRSSNPCSEYMFLDNSACNLASLNLVRFQAGADLNWPAFRQAVRVLLVAQDILVDYASYPTAEIAENSHRFRPLGLGYANLGGLLMRQGTPYDSEAAAQMAARITGALHAEALATSCLMAKERGAFSGWAENCDAAVTVLDQHAKHWSGDLPWVQETYAGLLREVERHGLRNAQVTLIAPTGTIGLLMDCDTLGIEPDFALIKRKTLAGGGEMTLVNQSVGPALRTLGYCDKTIFEISEHIRKNGTVVGASQLKPEHLAVFDCAIAPPHEPKRRVSPEGHLRIMAAAQPFLSGAISKTVNLPNSATVEDIEALFLSAWKLGLKAVAIYRDGSKALQPLCAEC